MEMQSSLSERKKTKKRDRIIQTATRLYRAQGFENTSVDQIALEAEVSRSTFFRYFGSKEMAAFPHHEEHLAAFRSFLKENPGRRPPLEKVFFACKAMAELYMENRKVHLEQQQIIQSSRLLIARGEELDNEWEEAIAEVLLENADTAAARRKARMAAGAIIGLIRAGMKQWYSEGCKWNLPDIVDEAASLIRI